MIKTNVVTSMKLANISQQNTPTKTRNIGQLFLFYGAASGLFLAAMATGALAAIPVAILSPLTIIALIGVAIGGTGKIVTQSSGTNVQTPEGVIIAPVSPDNHVVIP